MRDKRWYADILAHIRDKGIHPSNAFVTSGLRNMLADSYITFGATNGASGYGFRDNSGVMEWKNSGGAWAGFGGDIRFIDTNSFSIHTDAGKNWVATDIVDSIAIGMESQYTNNDGYGVISIGSRSLYSITANWNPSDVIAIGTDCGYGLQKIDSSILIGDEILYQTNAIASNPSANILIGHYILEHAPNYNGNYNVIIGYSACHTATMITGADNNVIIGSTIGNALTTAYSNVIIGMGTGNPLTSGSYNVMIGNYCANQAGSGITTGSWNTLLGNNAGIKLRGDSSYMVCIGTNSGPNTAGTYNNKLYIDDHNSDTPLIYADFATHTVTINGTLTSTGGGGGGLAHASLTQLDYASAGHTGFEPTITTLTMAKGGTAKALTASNGGIVYTDADSMEILIGTATAQKLLMSQANAAPIWSTPTYPNLGTLGKILIGDGTNIVLSTPKYPNASATAGKIIRSDGTDYAASTFTIPDTMAISTILYASAANVLSALATGNSGILVTSAGGVPSIATDIPTAVTIGSAYIYRASGTDVPVADGGTGLSTIADGSILVANTADVLTALTWHSAGTKMLVNTSGVLSMEAVTGSGAPVLANTPTLITPILGVATGTSIDLGGTTVYESRAITVDTGGVFNVNIGSAAGDDFTVDVDKFVVEGDTGRVGFGTVNPLTDFHFDFGVFGDQTLEIDDATTGYVEIVYRDAANKKWAIGYASDSYSVASLQNSFYFWQYRDKADTVVGRARFMINDAGNVGIDTLTASAKLAINGGVHVGGDSDPGDNNLLVDGQIQIRDSGIYIKSQADTFMDLVADGGVRIGDGVPTNYAKFAPDGELTLVGTARVKNILNLGLDGLASGGAAPAINRTGNFYGYEFDLNEDGYVRSFEMPYDWDSSVNPILKIHWYINEAYALQSGEVRWQVNYSPTAETGEAVDGATIALDTGDINIPATAKHLIESSITLTGIAVEDVIGIQIKRIALTAGNDPTADPVIVSLELEYTVNKLGEAL